MPRLPYRVLYNQDSTNLFGITKEPIGPQHVDAMVDEVARGGADVMLINSNAQRTSHPSRVWQTMWDGYEPGNRAFFGPVPDDTVAGREHWVAQMKRLADQGCDYLARALARCRQQGIAPGVSVRMNDMHDVPWPGSHLFSRFYLDNPQFRMTPHPVSSWGGSGLDYRHAPVREHVLALIRELIERYDFDVLDLDFLRFHCHVPRGMGHESAPLLTDLVRRVRQMLRATGRPKWLLARVATTPASAADLGMDVGAWAREGLIDGLAVGAFFCVPWRIDIDGFRRVVGPDVAILPCTEHAAARPHPLPDRVFSTDRRLIRGYAAGQYAHGADGIYFFNFFCAREEHTRVEPLFDAIAELRRPESLRGTPKTYLLNHGWNVAETDGPCPLPRAATTGRPVEFIASMAAEDAATPLEIEVWIEGPGEAWTDRFRLHVNETSLGLAADVRKLNVATQGPPHWAVIFRGSAGALRDGRNDLVFRNDGPDVTVRGLEARVG